MSLQKEILILAIILIGGSVVFSSKNINPITKTPIKNPAGNIESREASHQYTLSEKNVYASGELHIEKNKDSLETEISATKEQNESPQETEAEIDLLITEDEEENPTGAKTALLSIDDVLGDVQDMISEFRNGLKYPRGGCSSCNKTEEQTIEDEESVSINIPKDENIKIPSCPYVFASPGVGACNCATLGCTPPIGPWCVNPCCCVCCPTCCF